MQQSKSKTWIILGAVLLVLTVAGLVAGYLAFWAPPTKQDFTQAKSDAQKIATYSGRTLQREFSAKISSEFKTGKIQQALIDSATTEKQKTIDALDSRMNLAEAIRGSRVTRDKEVAAAFDTYMAREQRYSKYIRDYVDSFPLYMSSFGTCEDIFGVTKDLSDVTKLAASHTNAAADCKQDLASLSKSGIAPFAQYGKEFSRIVSERQAIFDALARKEVNADKSTSNKLAKLGDDFAKIDPTAGLQQYGKDAVFNNELNELIEVLSKKEKLAEEA